jgi:hypothetical protein
MYIVAIAWIYVILLISLTEASFVAGVASFVFYGVLPLALLLWLLGAGRRRRRRVDATPRLERSDDAPSAIDPDD